MARTLDPHAATVKAWETRRRAQNAGGGEVRDSRGDWNAPKRAALDETGTVDFDALGAAVRAAVAAQPSRVKHGEVDVGDTGKTAFFVDPEGRSYSWDSKMGRGPHSVSVHAHPDEDPFSAPDMVIAFRQFANGTAGGMMLLRSEGSGRADLLVKGPDWSLAHAKALSKLSHARAERIFHGTAAERNRAWDERRVRSSEYHRERIRAFVKANGGLVYHEGFNWKAGA